MKQELKKEIGTKMRKFRKSLGLTQAEIVAHFDIGRANYSRIEKGEVFPNAAILFTLKTKFNVSLDWLIGNDGDMFPEDAADNKKSDANGCGDEINDLMEHMETLPMVKHAVLTFFLEYKVKNNRLIQQLLDELKQEAGMTESLG